ncbi:EAL domain-containing protein [Oxalobacteraceae bacterium]|nr:EAL domain-containing protein [Oxalobacteraceae bacterium]
MSQRAPAGLLRWLRLGLETHISLPLFALLLLGAIWGATLHVIDNERANARRAAAESLREQLDTYEAQVARSLAGIDQTLKVLKYAVEMKGALGALPQLAQEDLLPPGVVFAVSIADREGRVVASHPAAPPISVADQDYFRFHRERDGGGTFVSQATRVAASQEWHLHFTRRVNDAHGRFAGIVILEADPAYFSASYERSRLGEQGMLGLVGTDGLVRVLRSGDKVSFGQRYPAAALGDSVAPQRSPWDGVRRYRAGRELPDLGLTVVAGLAEHEQMAAFERQRRGNLWEAGVASAVLLLLATLLWLWSWQGAKNRRNLRRIQETFAAASEASMDAFFILRALHEPGGEIGDFAFMAANSRAEQITGLSKQKLLRLTLCQLMPEARGNGMLAHLAEVVRVGGMHESEWENHQPQLRARWLHQQVVRVDGGVVAIMRDISERKLAEERMVHMARHDTLTGLPNRSMLADRLGQAIVQAERKQGAVLVAFIDLDGFKLVNDSLGHGAGDELLKIVAGRMGESVRAADTVGRIGGDEFVLVLPEQGGDGYSGAMVLERVRETVSRPIMLEGQPARVGCSIGVAVFPGDGRDADTLLMNADAAMYRAKQLGKNNCQFYAPEMNASVDQKLALLDDLRGALESGQFELLYQPRADLGSGRVAGVEALLRWHHPERGVLRPEHFLALADESGLMVVLGEWVLRTACAQNRAWQQVGLAPLPMAVNLSPRQFQDPALAGLVARVLVECRLAPQWLELELSEPLIMRDRQQSLTRMRELQAVGVSLTVDDFGSGNAGVAALQAFPVATLKVDQALVHALEHGADARVIVRATIALARQLKLRVCAEGVESAAQRAFLSEQGCDEMQGFLFSRPLPPDELESLLAAQTAAAP